MSPDELATLHALCFVTPRPWSTQEFTDLLQSPGVFLIANDRSFILGRLAGPEVELLTIAVSPENRNQGNGRRLVAQYHARAQKLDAEESFLEVAAGNTPAIALYLASGYTQTGKRPKYYTTPDGEKRDALVFSRTLAY